MNFRFDQTHTIFENFVLKAARELGVTGMFLSSDSKVVDWRDNENPPTDEALNAKVAELNAEYDAQEYARNRELEYPTIEELTVALYDTDDKAALETKRAAVKVKWPKDNSGPV